ncbi:ATP-binding protein [Thiocystis violacea]|uniref:ATP-binding protein n=1 Tax=Thiocystis violacea TaxID=13725 RepID=UPI0019064ED2|nr:ATP-binding protein [Thiocystis violacea]MBK1717364.1 (4Fe-4S)-binding protein [Thiocystis violacea]
MKQLVILSGKGGTGKTSVTAAFAHLAAQGPFAGRVLLADADVDAANLELVLQPRRLDTQPFRGGQVAVIDEDRCLICGDCESACRFDAIVETDGRWVIDPIACDGCAACVYQCPTESIRMQEQRVGECRLSDSRYGPLHHAHLHPGQENSGKLVTQVRQRARQQALDEERRLVIVDGPPGIGCPVIAAVSGADLALLVTEPTVSGIHDLRRALGTVQHFGVPALVCINKADVYPKGARDIETFCEANGIAMVGSIPFDPSIASALVAGEAVTAYRPEAPASLALSALWERLVSVLVEPPTRQDDGFAEPITDNLNQPGTFQ